jgi:IS605 OrfB family transposase
MSRYRLQPSPAQEAALAEMCAQARFVWNLAVEQGMHWKPGRKAAPGFVAQCRQLTEAREAFPWLAAGSVIVEQQALKDHAQAMAGFFARTDFVEKTSTMLARWFDVIHVEDLKIANMVKSAKGTMEKPGKNVAAKAGLNRGIHKNGWGQLVERLEHKAPGRVVKVNPAYTSQRCSACGHVAKDNRESQAVFLCVACGYTGNADVNAAINIAAGHAVIARGGLPLGRPVNREPQQVLLSA